MTATTDTLRMSDDERQQLDELGYVVRRGAFDETSIEEMRRASEEIIAHLVRIRTGTRIPFGAYTFEIEATSGVTIKWEGELDVVQGIEPFAHFHPDFERFAFDPRFIEPMKDVVGADELGLFTEKLNLKRARDGGPVVLHQDYPYWRGMCDDIDAIGTVMLLLDDSTVENGCLEVAPSSHRLGLQKGKEEWGFAQNEIDPAAFDEAQLIPVELAAGDMVMFGPLLVHRSQPNTSEDDRRALLFSYQPAGNRHAREFYTFKPKSKS